MTGQKKAVSSHMLLNTAGTVIYFVCQWLLTVLVVRLGNYEFAGVFSLAIAFSNIFSYIGTWGMRGIQVSDIDGEYSNEAFSGTRVVTNGIAILVFPALLLFYGYTDELAWCCAAAVIYKLLESVTDLHFGTMQRMVRYDWICVSYTLKGIIPLGAFVAGLKIGNSLLTALAAMGIGYLAVLLIYDLPRLRTSGLLRPRFDRSVELMKKSLPLMLTGMVNAWLIYLPRHAVQTQIGSETLGYYGSISTIVVILSTLSVPIYAVILPELSACIAHGTTGEIRQYLKKVLFIFLGVSVLAFAGGELLGPWGLSVIYGQEILGHMELLTPVLLNAILLLAVSFFDSYFIPLNRRGWLLAANLTALAICAATVRWATGQYGAVGACCSMTGALAVRLIILLIISEVTLRKRKAEEQAQTK